MPEGKCGAVVDNNALAEAVDEQGVVIESLSKTMIPKLVAQDIPLLQSLMEAFFPSAQYEPNLDDGLVDEIRAVCKDMCLSMDETFFAKVLQLYSVQEIAHGLMMVGPSGSGKSSAWRVLLKAIERWQQKKFDAELGAGKKTAKTAHYVIDPKAFSKDELYGALDPVTRDWRDGVFTSILRTILENQLGQLDYPSGLCLMVMWTRSGLRT